MSQYFLKPYEPFSGNINVKVDLSNYARKADIQNISHVDTSSFAVKTNLANLQTGVDKLDIDKLVPVPTDLSKLSDVVKNDVVKKTDYNKLVTKVDNIDTSGLVKKNDYNTKITEIEGKIPDTSNLATKTAVTSVENKIPDITNLATKTALTTFENKISDTSNLATKIALTTVENKIPDTINLVKKANYDTKITTINTESKKIYQKLIKDNHLFCLGDILFNSDDGSQAYLIFQPVRKYFKTDNNSGYISEWKSKGLSNKSIKPLNVENNNLTPQMNYYSYNLRVRFSGSCLQQSKIDYSNKKNKFLHCL